LINIVLIALVGTLAIRQCCIPSIPQVSHARCCPHGSDNQKPASCNSGGDQALVDKTAAAIDVAAADSDQPVSDSPRAAELPEALRPQAIVFDPGSPNLFLQHSALLI